MENEEERVSKKVIIEHSSGSGRQNIPIIVTLVVIALAIVIFIFMKVN